MNIDLKFAELQTPLFLAGTNFGVKLDTSKRTELKLVYDRTEKELMICYKGEISFQPTSNVANMVPVTSTEWIKKYWPNADLKKPTVAHAPTTPSKGRPKAQVATPTSHVFEAPK